MSLRPDARSGGRSRSKSPAARDRDRSRSRDTREDKKAPSSSSRKDRGYDEVASPVPPAAPVPPSYGNGAMSPTYEVRPSISAGGSRSNSSYYGQPSGAPANYPPTLPPGHYPPHDDGGYTMGDYKDLPPQERPGYGQPSAQFPSAPRRDDDGLAYGDIPSPSTSRHNSYAPPYPPQSPQAPYSTQSPQAPYPPQAPYRYNSQDSVPTTSRSSSYSYQYAQVPENISYTAKPQTGSHSSQGQYYDQPSRNYGNDSYDQGARIVDITPGKPGQGGRGRSPTRLSVEPGMRGPSPGLSSGMNRLSVGAALGAAGAGAGSLPPPSPLLEAYQGTYQQMSPMPFALRPPNDDDELAELEPLSPTVSRSSGKGGVKFASEKGGKEKKRVTVYDPEEDAKTISKALGQSRIDTKTIYEMLPGLSHDQIVYLRKEYKKLVKVQGKGVNLSKHIKTKLTGNFGKAAYVTSLGRWESEGYWANFFYQSHGSRRELLIESLMGRTNAEIWNIKDEFKDKRYSDSLVKCMEKELKMDKFRTAVLMVLEERRQEEQDVYPTEYRDRDVDTLHRALTAKQGGESVMLEIIIRRSDSHLREVLRTYQAMYQDNFPRAALQKSNNLVGEVIAHILNGVINKPARDALLLQHAIKDIAERNKDEELRYELLISRLVRVHWDKMHLMRVKKEYYDRYRKHLEEDIEDATGGDFSEFMYNLCATK